MPRRRRPTLAMLLPGVVAVAMLVLGGCGDDATVTQATDEADDVAGGGDGGDGADGADEGTAEGRTGDLDDPAPFDPVELAGSSWTLRRGAGPEGEVPLVDGWPITLTFDGERLGGTAACNGYGGTYSIQGSQLSVGELGQTSAGCLPEVQESERIYLAALAEVDGVGLAGDELALSGPSTELLFEPNQPIDLAGLVGRLWLLEATLLDGVARDVLGEPATLFLAGDGTATAGTGCRALAGNYIVAGNEVIFTDLAAEGDCPTSLFDQDSRVIAVIGDGFVPLVDGDSLVLSSVGNEGLRYRATTDQELAELPGVPAVSDAALLDGVEWVFAGGDGPTGPIPDPREIDPDRPITFTLADGGYTGTAVCIPYGGPAEVGNGRITLDVPTSQEEGCGDRLDAIAATFLDVLPLMTEFGLEADGQRLVANGSDVELWFDRAS